jgi:hypothetical protein
MAIRPNRANGTENVTMLGVTLRMTITSDGFAGMSFDDMAGALLLLALALVLLLMVVVDNDDDLRRWKARVRSPVDGEAE